MCVSFGLDTRMHSNQWTLICPFTPPMRTFTLCISLLFFKSWYIFLVMGWQRWVCFLNVQFSGQKSPEIIGFLGPRVPVFPLQNGVCWFWCWISLQDEPTSGQPTGYNLIAWQLVENIRGITNERLCVPEGSCSSFPVAHKYTSPNLPSETTSFILHNGIETHAVFIYQGHLLKVLLENLTRVVCVQHLRQLFVLC